MSNKLELGVDALEKRQMMAVDVSFSSGSGLLRLVGDNASDVVHVEGRGNVEVFVNGTQEGSFTGVRSIRAIMRGGDDSLFVSAVNVHNITANLGSGGDTFDLDTTVSNLSSGNDDSVNTRAVNVQMGGNAGDLVEIHTADGRFIQTSGRIRLLGVADVEMDGSGGPMPVLRGLTIRLSGHGDVNGDGYSVHINDAIVSRTNRILGSAAADHVRFSDNRWVGPTFVRLGAGDDTLDLNSVGEQCYDRRVVFHGGSGFDTFLDDPVDNNFKDADPIIVSFS